MVVALSGAGFLGLSPNIFFLGLETYQWLVLAVGCGQPGRPLLLRRRACLSGYAGAYGAGEGVGEGIPFTFLPFLHLSTKIPIQPI